MRPLLRIVALGLAAVLLATCSIDKVTFTQGDEDCAAAGDEDGNGLADCADPACAAAPACQPMCGNGELEAGEGCDDGNGMDGDGCDNNCTVTGCGNGIQSSTEACDDGNTVSGDGCDNNCTVTACGNDVTTAGEACDDGNLVSGDGCDENCTVTACGNAIPTTGEACDDGNATNGDGCDENCTITACGNGIPTMGEECDDGNATSGDGCDVNCTVTACGNGILTMGEACDDGNLTSGDGCDANCTLTACGNGVITMGEVCDDGNATNGDGCDNNCTVTACGNGIVTGTEQCDDGNATNGDGCDNDCTFSSASVPANPAVWLRFDDPPGDGVLDSGAGHTATCTSCPQQVPGLFGGAYRFTATNRVDVAASPDLGPGTAFTVAAWIRVDTATTNVGVIGCKNHGTANCTYALTIISPTRPSFFSVGHGHSTVPTDLPLGAWHHMAMTWNGATMVGYINGVMVVSAAVPTMTNDPTTALSVGDYNSSPPLPFTGAIDNFVLYNRVLSAAELTHLATPPP